MKKIFILVFILFFAASVFAQDDPPVCPDCPEDQCKAEGEYWSDDLSRCFLVADMDSDETLVFRQIQAWEREKFALNHEDNEYKTPAKNTRRNNYNARITSLTSKRDATSDAEVKATYQAEIDRLEAERDFHDAKTVNHGTLISDLSRKIGKHKEELDKLLTQ